jgi:hypothetical protein
LAQDEDKSVRSSVAQNPNTPLEVLRELLDNEPSLDFSSNPLLPVEILLILVQKYNLGWNISNNPSLPVEILQILSRNEEAYVRGKVASNSLVPLELLQLLAKDSDHSVRGNVARNL